jgi:hypothetical protein
MTDQPSSQKSGANFLKPFVLGIVLGLVIGGLGGAYLSGYTETSAPKFKPVVGKPAPVPTGPREVRPGDAAPTAPTGEAPTNKALPEPGQPK